MNASARKCRAFYVAATAFAYAVLAGATSAQSDLPPLVLTAWETYWVIGEPAMDMSPMCVPAVRFTLKNRSDHDLDGVEVSASFLGGARRVVFGGGVDFWSAASGQPALPPDYTREVELRSTHGFKYLPESCLPGNLPELSVKVQA